MSDLLLGRYKPIAQAGEGGYAQVIVAWDTRIERRVAIKCLQLEQELGVQSASETGELTAVQMDMLEPSLPGLAEARTAAKLTDANIVSVYDFEVAEGVAYLIMEYIEGMSLGELMREYPGFIDADVVAAVFKAVAHALQVAHRNQVLHLDIKPDNILIDRQGHVKVVDFGIARLAGSAGFGAAEGGTIGYMPPEQMNREDLDERCDEWALAAVTYEMISGENPFMVNTLEEAEAAIMDAEVVIPSLCMDGLDEAADDVLFCALDPYRDERYDTVKEFADELQPCLGSTRKGTKQLAYIVGHAVDEEAAESGELALAEQEDEYEEYVRTGPLIDSLPAALKGVALRLTAAFGSAFVAAAALANSPLTLGFSNPWFWGVLAMVAVVGGVFPSVGVALAALAFGVVLVLNSCYVLGVLLIVAAPIWWFFVGRGSPRASCVAAIPGVLGAIGLAAFTPFAAGYLLRVREALLTTAFALLLAFGLGALGSRELGGWDPTHYLVLVEADSLNAATMNMVLSLGLWMQVAAWALGALVMSLCCSRENRGLAVVGALVVLALLIVALLAGVYSNTGAVNLLNPLSLVALVLCALLAAGFIAVGVPAREE